MNDYEREFYKDSKEKRIIGTGANHKKGTRSKGCRFPYENLRGKERKEYMSSETTVKKLGEIYDWKEYKKLPDDEKKICLNAHGHKYAWNCHIVAIALGVGLSTITTEVKRLHLMDDFKKNKPKGFSRSETFNLKEKARKDHLEGCGINKTPEEPTPVKEKLSIPDETENNVVKDIVRTVNKMKQDEVKFQCTINTKLTGDKFSKRMIGISGALDRDGLYEVTLCVKEIENNG